MEGAIDSNKSNEGERRKSRDPLVGTLLDERFQIEEVLGSGGMSVVYKATQLRVNRHVAIKTIRLQLDSKPIYRERFEREIASLCALSHPHIVTVYDCIIGQDDQPYVVMDYLRGKSLETLIQQDGPLTVERFARIFVQVCSALDHAHRKGIIHRDIKPGNIVLIDNETDYVKVVDFGLAKIGEDNRKLTQSGELWGSPPYMSPEQCQGKSGDERSDIYSLGAVMFEMLTGHDPFYQAASVFELIQNHVNSPVPSIQQVRPGAIVPFQVENVIRKAMAKEPAERFQTAQDLQDAIIDACSGKSDRDSGDLMLRGAGGRTRPPSGEVSKDSIGVPSTSSAASVFNRALDPFGSEDFSSYASGESLSASASETPDLNRQSGNSGVSPDPAQPPQGYAPSPPPSRMRQLDVPPETRSNSKAIIIAIAVGVVVVIGAVIAVPQLMKKETTAGQPVTPSSTATTTSTSVTTADTKTAPPVGTTSSATPPATTRPAGTQIKRTTSQATSAAPRQVTRRVAPAPVRRPAPTARTAPAPKPSNKNRWDALEDMLKKKN